ncbi:MAG: hypothetical protein NT039_03760 [Candidatus Berkelbacteria bacterium]|nr:hypothetical protein [Candidatus Berkelbacteria bacterium]
MARAKIETYDQWLQQWQGASNEYWEVARGLLYCLPDVIQPKGFFREEDPSLVDYFRALYGAMDITMEETDEGLLDYARRAVAMLFLRCVPEGELPFITVKGRHGVYWDNTLYRQLPQHLIRYASHPNSYGTNEKQRDGARACVSLVLGSEALRRDDVVDFTTPFEWPDLTQEPYRTQLARGIIIHLDRFLWDMPTMLDHFFELLIDARDFSHAQRKKDYPRHATQTWPWMDPEKLDDRVHRLGLILGKRPQEILCPGNLEKARERGHYLED